MTVTSWPALSSSATSNRPINIVPPITRTFIVDFGFWISDVGFQTFAGHYPTSEIRNLTSVPLVVILLSQVRDQVLALHPAQRVLQLHELDENVMLRIKARRGHRRFEVEREPLLHAAHACPLGQIHEQHQVQNQ